MCFTWTQKAAKLFLISSFQEKSKSIPDDVAKDMRGVQTQLRNHVALEHELSGNEQQVMKVICGL